MIFSIGDQVRVRRDAIMPAYESMARSYRGKVGRILIVRGTAECPIYHVDMGKFGYTFFGWEVEAA